MLDKVAKLLMPVTFPLADTWIIYSEHANQMRNWTPSRSVKNGRMNHVIIFSPTYYFFVAASSVDTPHPILHPLQV